MNEPVKMTIPEFIKKIGDAFFVYLKMDFCQSADEPLIANFEVISMHEKTLPEFWRSYYDCFLERSFIENALFDYAIKNRVEIIPPDNDYSKSNELLFEACKQTIDAFVKMEYDKWKLSHNVA